MLYFGPEKSLKSSNLQIVRIFPYSGLRIRSLDEHRLLIKQQKKSYRHSSFTFDNTFMKMHFTTCSTTRLVVAVVVLVVVLVVIIANRL